MKICLPERYAYDTISIGIMGARGTQALIYSIDPKPDTNMATMIEFFHILPFDRLLL